MVTTLSETGILKSANDNQQKLSATDDIDASTTLSQEAQKLSAQEYVGKNVEKVDGSQYKTAQSGDYLTASRSKVYATEGSKVVATNNSFVTASRGSEVDATDSQVNAQAGSKVIARAGSVVEAHPGSEVVALPGSKIILHEGVKLSNEGANVVKIEDIANAFNNSIGQNGADPAALAKAFKDNFSLIDKSGDGVMQEHEIKDLKDSPELSKQARSAAELLLSNHDLFSDLGKDGLPGGCLTANDFDGFEIVMNVRPYAWPEGAAGKILRETLNGAGHGLAAGALLGTVVSVAAGPAAPVAAAFDIPVLATVGMIGLGAMGAITKYDELVGQEKRFYANKRQEFDRLNYFELKRS